MKIVRVEAFAVQAPPVGTYWGKATWGARGTRSSPRSVGPIVTPGEHAALWGRHPAPGRSRPVYSGSIDTCIVRLTTDTGLVGWGEAKAPVAPMVAKTIVDELFADTLIGSDPFDVEVLWETLYASMRLRGHASGFLLEAISGVDIALWDLIGKATGQPVAKLLGGTYRDRVRVYASGVPASPAPEGSPEWEAMLNLARSYLDRGFLGFKVAIGLNPKVDVRAVRALRELAGPDLSVHADAAGNYDVPTAIRVGRELEALDVGFFELPIPHEHIGGYAEVARALAIPIANDVLASRYHALEYLKCGGLDLLQPDVCRAGGITELKRTAVLADAFGAAFTPHVSIGSAIHFAASVHLAAASPNFNELEFWAGHNPLGDAVLRVPALEIREGHLGVPTGPGLGLDLDEEKLLAHAVAREAIL